MIEMIPDKMKAVVQNGPGEKLIVKEVDVPRPGKGEVLIRMEKSPINPSDLSFLQGTYIGKPNYPVIPGIEGSGTVVASGKGVLPYLRKKKRVTCSSTPGSGGTWAEYMVTSAMRCIPVSEEITFEQASMMIVNPLTAMGFIDIAKQLKCKAIINNAAASALGKMVDELCAKNNIKLINIVRKQEHVDQLKKEGRQYILNSSEEKFSETLEQLANKLSAKVAFDAVGGKNSGTILAALPKESRLILYANLSEENVVFDPRNLLQNDKTIQGFYLGNYNKKQGLFKSMKTINNVKKMLGAELSSTIQKEFDFNFINEAIDFYRGNMSKGKVIVACNV